MLGISETFPYLYYVLRDKRYEKQRKIPRGLQAED